MSLHAVIPQPLSIIQDIEEIKHVKTTHWIAQMVAWIVKMADHDRACLIHQSFVKFVQLLQEFHCCAAVKNTTLTVSDSDHVGNRTIYASFIKNGPFIQHDICVVLWSAMGMKHVFRKGLWWVMRTTNIHKGFGWNTIVVSIVDLGLGQTHCTRVPDFSHPSGSVLITWAS